MPSSIVNILSHRYKLHCSPMCPISFVHDDIEIMQPTGNHLSMLHYHQQSVENLKFMNIEKIIRDLHLKLPDLQITEHHISGYPDLSNV